MSKLHLSKAFGVRIPLKQIKVIIQKPDAVTAIEIFRQNISELEDEITAFSMIRSIRNHFVNELQKTTNVQIQHMITQDDKIPASIESLSLKSINFKEDKTMDNLKKAEESLSKLGDMRIIYLPPATIAAAHHIGDDPESYTNKIIDRFVRDTGLCTMKPDLRHYGFNHPNRWMELVITVMKYG